MRKLNKLKRANMKVRARHQVAYKGVGYRGGDVFEIDKEDFEQYKNDVIPVNERGGGNWRKPVTKEVKKEVEKKYSRVDMMDKFEKETGKNAIWLGEVTKQYLRWLKKHGHENRS